MVDRLVGELRVEEVGQLVGQLKLDQTTPCYWYAVYACSLKNLCQIGFFGY